jgi:hypothetical protein
MLTAALFLAACDPSSPVVSDAGFDAVLVGHSLLKQADQEAAVRELLPLRDPAAPASEKA